MERTERNTLRRLRRLASKQGLRLVKPYSREPFKIDGFTLLKPSGKVIDGRPMFRPVLGGQGFGATLPEIAQYLSGCLAVLMLLVAPATAQVFDPDPNEPNAQQVAEFRAAGAFLGLTPPPIGWHCYVTTPLAEQGIYFQDFVCEPDPESIERQERERQEWERRLVENGGRVYRELSRRRR